MNQFEGTSKRKIRSHGTDLRVEFSLPVKVSRLRITDGLFIQQLLSFFVSACAYSSEANGIALHL